MFKRLLGGKKGGKKDGKKGCRDSDRNTPTGPAKSLPPKAIPINDGVLLECCDQYPASQDRLAELLLDVKTRLRRMNVGDIAYVSRLVSANDENGCTALHLACKATDGGRLLSTIVGCPNLLTPRALAVRDSGDKGYTAVHYACANEREVVKHLLRLLAPAQLLIFDKSGAITPLHLACANEGSDVLGLLLDQGNPHLTSGRALVTAQALGHGKRGAATPLHLLCSNDAPHATGAVRSLVRAKLLDRGALKTKDKHGDTPLHLACNRTTGDVLRAFVEAKESHPDDGLGVPDFGERVVTPAALAARNKKGETPLHRASLNKFRQKFDVGGNVSGATGAIIIEALVARGLITADSLAVEDAAGHTPLYHAALNRQLEVLLALLVAFSPREGGGRLVTAYLCDATCTALAPIARARNAIKLLKDHARRELRATAKGPPSPTQAPAASAPPGWPTQLGPAAPPPPASPPQQSRDQAASAQDQPASPETSPRPKLPPRPRSPRAEYRLPPPSPPKKKTAASKSKPESRAMRLWRLAQEEQDASSDEGEPGGGAAVAVAAPAPAPAPPMPAPPTHQQPKKKVADAAPKETQEKNEEEEEVVKLEECVEID